jgi:hypothetical protein
VAVCGRQAAAHARCAHAADTDVRGRGAAAAVGVHPPSPVPTPFAVYSSTCCVDLARDWLENSSSGEAQQTIFANWQHMQSLSALVIALQGGNDAQLLAHSCDAFMQHHPTRVCRIPQRPLTSIATAAGASTVLLSAHGTDADLWRLPAVHQVL